MTLAAQFHFDGANGSTTLTDGATPANTGTCFGTTALSTTQFIQGSASLRLPGTSTSHYAEITAAGGGGLSMTGDFALSFRLWRDTTGSGTPLSCPTGLQPFFEAGSGITMQWSGLGAAGTLNVGDIPAGEFVAVALTRKDGIFRAFAGGFLAATSPVAVTATIDLGTLILGKYAPNGNFPFAGYIDQLTIYKNEVPWLHAYDPDTLAANDTCNPKSLSLLDALITHAPTWPMPDREVLTGSSVRDIYFGGRGRVAGTVKTKGTPNFATRARVRLINELDGVCLREQWSDAVTGEYSFDWVDPALRYTVVAYDHTHSFRAVIADNLSPSLIP